MVEKIVNKMSFVISKTPLRIGLMGGGTDLPKYYEKYGGSTISTTIDKYIYVTVKRHNPIFNEKYRLNYFKSEVTNNVDEIENDIVRESIKFLGITDPLYISTISDLPAKSGLGSSSSFTVGLLNALHAINGSSPKPSQIAEEACYIEIEKLKKNIGKQDQYSAAFGGINNFLYKQNGKVQCNELQIEETKLKQIFSNMVLIWTNIQRDADEILTKQNKEMDTKIENYYLLKSMTETLKDILTNNNEFLIDEMGQLVEDSWSIKRTLENTISRPEIIELHNSIKEYGGKGGKLCGAGGGGFLLEFIEEKVLKDILLQNVNMSIHKIKFEPLGSRILFKE